MSKEQFSFNKGWLQLRQADIAACRRELMEAFNVTTRAAFLQRLKGNVIPNVLEAHNVEKVFAKERTVYISHDFIVRTANGRGDILKLCRKQRTGLLTQDMKNATV